MIRKLSFLLLCLLPLILMANKSRQALKALEDGEYDKVIDYLEKSIERDSLNPNTEYVYALLYITDSFPGYNVDIAYGYIMRSIRYLGDMNEEHIKEMEKSEIAIEDIYEVKKSIDQLAFFVVKRKNTISDYEAFMERYTDAAEFEEAMNSRNLLAFKRAEKKGTWQSYEEFYMDYPHAGQVSLAKQRFEHLVYQAKTRSESSEELEDFLIEYPATPYRTEIEHRIFNLKVAALIPEDLYEFVNAHHNPSLTRKAFNILYHRGELDASKLKSFNAVALKQFEDSIKEIRTLNLLPLLPILDGGSYHFLNLEGDPLVGMSYPEIDKKYYCGNVKEEFLLVSTGQTTKLVNRQGHSVFVGEIDNYEDAGDGILLLNRDGQWGALHYSGFEILPFEFSEIKWLAHRLFSCRKGGKMALYNFSGEMISEAVFDDISLVGNYWIFQNGESLAVSNFDEIVKNDKFSLAFNESFEEVELIGEKHLIAFEEETEVLFNEKLKRLSPPSTERINTRFDTWVFQKPSGYQIFDKENDETDEIVYDEVLQNKEWLGLKRNDKWEVRSKTLHDDPILSIDSLKLLGEDIAIIFRDQEGMAIFPNKKIVHIKQGEYLTSIVDPAKSDSHFLVVKRGGANILYRDGVKLFESEYDDIGYISDNFFQVSSRGKYGAVDDQGRLIMRVRYDAIGKAKNGVASVILDSKFGAYNFDDKILLRLDFEETLTEYNDQLLKVKEGGLYGLLDRRNNLIVEPEFEDITYWSDSTFLVKEDDRWLLMTIRDQQELFNGIIFFEHLKNTKEEKVIKFLSEEGWGVYHSQLGEIIPPAYNDIYNLGSEQVPFYFAEHSFPEADYFVVVYYNAAGEKIKTDGYSADQFLKIVCDEP